MDGIGEEGGGIRLSKRFGDNKAGSSGEVDYKTTAGTAWSHSYLNQKPWHPLSYPNQRRKWIAEQTHAQRQRRAEEVAREYAQEQDFFRQTALISKKEKEKVEMMKAVSFMYVRPPGYNAESAKAAEIADDRKRTDQNTSDYQSTDEPSATMARDPLPGRDEEKKKPRPKDVFGRPLPTEEEFEILKNAPRLETGVSGRVKPFGVEVRNVKCLRCGNYGHQSGDRECPLKDVIMPNEESRLKRDDPLTAIMAQMDRTEPLKWELKQKPGMSPPRGGFQPDDPNQQIVAEDIFDEYGGFLSGDNIPDLLTNFSYKPKKRLSSSKKSKHRRQLSPSSRELEISDQDGLSSPSDGFERKSKKEKKTKKKKKRENYSGSSSSDGSELDRHQRRRRRRQKHLYSSEDSDSDSQHRVKHNREKHSYTTEDSDSEDKHKVKRSRQKHTYSSEEFDRHHRKSKHKHSYSSEDSNCGRHDRKRNSNQKPYTSDDIDAYKHRNKKSRRKHSNSSEDNDGHDRKNKDKHSYHPEQGRHENERRKKTMQKPCNSEDLGTNIRNRSDKSRHKHHYSSEDDADRHAKSEKRRHKHYSSHGYGDSDSDAEHRSRHRRHHH